MAHCLTRLEGRSTLRAHGTNGYDGARHARGSGGGSRSVTILLGYADLARGGTTIAPILLVAGYCVLVPHRDPEVAVEYGRLHNIEGTWRARPARASLVRAFAGRIAQLVRAPALHAGCRGFESLFAHAVQVPPSGLADPVRPVGVRLFNALEVTTVKASHRFALSAAGLAAALAASTVPSVASAQRRQAPGPDTQARTRHDLPRRRRTAASSSRTRSATGSRATSASAR